MTLRPMQTSANRTGPVMRNCAVCGVAGAAPDILPYLRKSGGHTWAHQSCAMQTLRDELAENHEHGDGV